MATVVGICNRALQKLGANRITAIDEDSNNARECNACYEPIRDALLRALKPGFALKRAALAAESPAPTWGRANAFVLPADSLAIYSDYPEDNTAARDYLIENGRILSDFTAPLYLRYISVVTDPNVMDALFRELLAHDMAIEMCEAITQSNQKKDRLVRDRSMIVAEARKANSFEKPSPEPPEDSWLTVRQ